MIAVKLNILIRKLYKFFKPGKTGVRLQFNNEGAEDILFLRVIIADQVKEFRDIRIGESTIPIILNESPLYFYSYIVTKNERLYFEPNNADLTKKVKKGRIIISVFIQKKVDGQQGITMYPNIGRS